MPDEEEYLERIRKGDSEAAGAFFDAYFPAVYGFLYTRTWHRQTAEDLASHTFLKVLPHLKRFDSSRGSVKSLLFKAAHTAVIDHYRTQHKHVYTEAAWDIPDLTDIPVDTDAHLRLAEVKKTLEDLLPTERSIVVLHVWDGLSHAEIGTLLGKREDAVKMAYSRAIRKLRHLL